MIRLLSWLVQQIFTETQEKVPDRVRRPPRWEWFTREVIRGNGSGQETPMVTRYRLVKTPRGSLFVHQWHRPDSDKDCHNHPWWFGTLILRGGYTEERRENPGKRYSSTSRVQHRRFRWHTTPLDVAHRVVELEPNTWTLLLVGPKVRSWGFYVHDVRATVYDGTGLGAGLGSGLASGEWRVVGETRLPISPRYVPWQVYIAAGGNPDPFNC